jgi:large conductance mechanosensitive channel
MGMISEFKSFAMKGNVMDLAIATVLGAAFNAIVGAVVDNILMPFIGIITGGVNFDGLGFTVGDATIKYGVAIGALVKFIIIAFFLFMVVKGLNKMKQPEAPAPAGPSQEELLTQIRDLLKK